jgi:hypothetical protein
MRSKYLVPIDGDFVTNGRAVLGSVNLEIFLG